MKEKKGICTVCNQHRTLISVSYQDDRITKLIISHEPKFFEYICHKCRKKIDKEIKKGKHPELKGKDFTLMGFGLPKHLERIHNDVEIEKRTIRECFQFINNEYGKWIDISSKDKFKYHLACLIWLLSKRNLENELLQLKEYISKNFTNTSMNEINQKIVEMKNWCQRWTYHPFT